MRLTIDWPSQDERALARAAFAQAVEAYSATVAHDARPAGAGDDGQEGDGGPATPSEQVSAEALPDDTDLPAGPATEVAPEPGPERWSQVVRQGAPDFVRANLWLTMGWAARCVGHEEPRLVWLGAGATTLVGSSMAYTAIRHVVGVIAGE